MKDAMMPQVKSVSSRSTVFSQVSALPTKQAKAVTQMSEQRLRCPSAATLGITVLIGAMSALLPSQDAQATATRAVSSNFLVAHQIDESPTSGKTQPLAQDSQRFPEVSTALPAVIPGIIARNQLTAPQATANPSRLAMGLDSFPLAALREPPIPERRSQWNQVIPLPEIASTEVVPSLAARTWSRRGQISRAVGGAVGGSVPIPRTPDSDPLESVELKTLANSVYQVQPGDTLEAIAHRYQISSANLVQTNEIRNPNLIEVGQQLLLPYTEATDSTLPLPSPLPAAGLQALEPNLADARGKLKADVMKLQQEYKAPMHTQLTQVSSQSSSTGIKERRKLHRQQYLPLQATATAPQGIEDYYTRLHPLEGQIVEPELPPLSSPEQYLPDSSTRFDGYIWPSTGVITSGYGKRWGKMHKGIDIAGPVGTPIIAVAPGEVMTAGWNSGGYGNLVELKHSDGSLTLYAHNSRVLVRRGQQVQQGQLIAEMGSSGYSTGPHLHFEIHPSGRGAVNPIAYLPKQQ